jgi:hypothetical protein
LVLLVGSVLQIRLDSISALLLPLLTAGVTTPGQNHIEH